MRRFKNIARNGLYCCLCLFSCLSPQAWEDTSIHWDIQGALGQRDLSLLGQCGWGPTFHSLWTGVILQGEIRPIRRQVLVQENATTQWRFRENRGSLGAGVGLDLGISPRVEAVLSAGGLYSWGSYRGTLRPAVSDWFPWAETGLKFAFGNQWHWGIRYQWHPLPSVSPHRMALVLGLQIPERANP